MSRPALVHLRGATLSALADGQLCPRSTDRALAHVTRCARCRERLEDERAARRAVAAVPAAEPSAELLSRLVGMSLAAPPGESQPVVGHLVARRSAARRGSWAFALAATGGVAAAVGGLFLLGGSPVGVDVDDLSPEPAAAAAAVVASLGAPAPSGDLTAPAVVWMRTHGWVVPEVVPDHLSVVSLALDDERGVLVVELAGETARVVLTERRGRIAADVFAESHALRVGSVPAHLVSTAPWTAVVQCGDTVVTVASHGSSGPGRQIVAALPTDPPDMSPAARIARGWSAVTDAVLAPVLG